MISSIAFSACSQKPKSSLIKNGAPEEQYVCLMTGAEQRERQQELKTEVFSQVKKYEELENGYTFYFKYDEKFLMKMTDYVIAENNCCPFLTFNTQLHSKNDVMLQITGGNSKETYEITKGMVKAAFIDKP